MKRLVVSYVILVSIFMFSVLADGLDLPIQDPRRSLRNTPPAPVTSYSFHNSRDGDIIQNSSSENLLPKDEPTFFGQPIPVGEWDTIVYVIDSSGSMSTAHTKKGNIWLSRLDIAKSELVKSVNDLSEHIQFNCISFNCSVRPMWNSPKHANEKNKVYLREWVESLRPGGGTNTGPATVTGFASKPARVVLLTDGAPNCQLDSYEHRQFIRNNNTTKCPVDVFGIQVVGNEEMFCRQVAYDSVGTFTAVR